MRPRGRLATLVEDVLPHLTSLRFLDLGQDTGFGLTNLQITTTPTRLTYVRISLGDVAHLYHLMSNKTLSTTLEQLHVTLRSKDPLCEKLLPEDLELPPMINLHTFTLIQTILSDNRIEWSTIESITTPDHMPVLRRVNLAIFITVIDLYRINRSLLFTDDRRIDVQFAFILESASVDIQSIHQMVHGSRFHPRQAVGVTCVLNVLPPPHRHLAETNCHVSIFIVKLCREEEDWEWNVRFCVLFILVRYLSMFLRCLVHSTMDIRTILRSFSTIKVHNENQTIFIAFIMSIDDQSISTSYINHVRE